MTATERLRELLDERGIKWVAVTSLITYFEVDGREYRAYEYDGMGEQLDGLQIVNTTPYTPEQAIAATLGPCSRPCNCTNDGRTDGTCRDVRSEDHIIAFECSECGCWVAYDEFWETGIYVQGETGQEHIHPLFCPNCGAKVVGE